MPRAVIAVSPSYSARFMPPSLSLLSRLAAALTRTVRRRSQALEKYLDGGFNEGAVARQVMTGKYAMPAFSGRLSDEDIANVAAYVITTSEAGWDGEEGSGPVLAQREDQGAGGGVIGLAAAAAAAAVAFGVAGGSDAGASADGGDGEGAGAPTLVPVPVPLGPGEGERSTQTAGVATITRAEALDAAVVSATAESLGERDADTQRGGSGADDDRRAW